MQKQIKKKTHYTINLNTTANNCIICVSKNNGKVIFWESSGKNKLKGSKKSTPYAVQKCTENICNYIKKKKKEKVFIKIKGAGKARDPFLRTINSNGIEIISINDVTNLPHNGCRPKKRRRI